MLPIFNLPTDPRPPPRNVQMNLKMFRVKHYIHQKQLPLALVSKRANNNFCPLPTLFDSYLFTFLLEVHTSYFTSFLVLSK